jgi:hypothetical protein
VRRLWVFVLVVLIAAWLPARQARATTLENASSTDGSARPQQPAPAACVAPSMIAATSGGWQARAAADALEAPFFSLRLPDYSFSASVFPARLHFPAAPPLRKFPLLI